MRGPTLGQTRAQPFGNRCGGLTCFVPTSPRGSAPLAQSAREAAPFSLTLGIAELRRPPPRPPLMRSSYAGSTEGVCGALVGSARSVWRGCSPAPPLRRAATPAGGALRLHDPPAGPLARAPRARWPTSRPSAGVDVRCRLARGLVGCAVPNVSCGRLFSGCALGLGLAPKIFVSRSCALRRGLRVAYYVC